MKMKTFLIRNLLAFSLLIPVASFGIVQGALNKGELNAKISCKISIVKNIDWDNESYSVIKTVMFPLIEISESNPIGSASAKIDKIDGSTILSNVGFEIEKLNEKNGGYVFKSRVINFDQATGENIGELILDNEFFPEFFEGEVDICKMAGCSFNGIWGDSKGHSGWTVKCD